MGIFAIIAKLLGRVHSDSEPVLQYLVAGKVTYVTGSAMTENVFGDSDEGRKLTNYILMKLTDFTEQLIEDITNDSKERTITDLLERYSAQFAHDIEKVFPYVKINGKFSCFQQMGWIGIKEMLDLAIENKGIVEIQVSSNCGEKIIKI